jgi:hypothetical protein
MSDDDDPVITWSLTLHARFSKGEKLRDLATAIEKLISENEEFLLDEEQTLNSYVTTSCTQN